MALACGACWFSVEVMTHQKYPTELIPLWNALVRTSVFCLVSGLEAEVLERKSVERRLNQTNDDLQKQSAILESVLKSISEAGDRERRRLGEDLHDGLCQHLVSTAFDTRKLVAKLAVHSPAESADAAQIAELLSESISQARDVARGLYLVPLEAGGLGSALDEFATQTRARHGIACEFLEKSPVPALEEALGTNLFRIAQEAVNNALKHSQASRITITLSADLRQICLDIADDGAGLPTSGAPARGLGLRIMNHRARMVGASLNIGPRPGGGTLVSCSVPRPDESAAEAVPAYANQD
jgi:signal transduction histidine kinase